MAKITADDLMTLQMVSSEPLKNIEPKNSFSFGYFHWNRAKKRFQRHK